MGANRSVDTLGAFIAERYAPWAREHLGAEATARLNEDLADWLAEPLVTLSAGSIETWRRDHLNTLGQPALIDRRLQVLDSCLCKAVEWQLLERNPLRDVRREPESGYLIELFAGGVGHTCLREGWAPVGVDWTWTLGKRAVLELPPIRTEADHVLRIDIAGVYKKYPQRLIVTLNEMTVGMILCRGPASYEFFVPARALAAPDRIELVLKVPAARRPSDHDDSNDNRFVGFRVAKLHLQPINRSQRKRQAQQPAADELPDLVEQRAALQDMVSLGFDCHFGFAQRHLGAEPMSLFRWANAPLDRMIDALGKRFAGLGAREALDIQVSDDGEFVVEDKVYGFRYHTFVFAAQGGVQERVLRSEHVRIGVLCKTLLQELREQSKLFVFHDAGASTLDDVRRLSQGLRAHGDNTLVWMVGASAAGQAGTARLIEPGLIQGYVSGFQVGLRSPHLPSWVSAACRAHRIWRGAGDAPQDDD